MKSHRWLTFHEINDFFDNLEINSPIVSHRELLNYIGPMQRSLSRPDDFDHQRLAILIYLSEHFLHPRDKQKWLDTFHIHVAPRTFIRGVSLIGHFKTNESDNAIYYETDDEVLETLVLSETDEPTSATLVSEVTLVSETTLVSQATSVNYLSQTTEIEAKTALLSDESDISEEETLPEKIQILNIPTDSENSAVRQIFDQDFECYRSIHQLSDAKITEIYLKNYETDLITDLGYTDSYIKDRLDHYASIPQHAQKSDDWLKQRTMCITASALADALGEKGQQARCNLLLNKVSEGAYSTFFGNFYTRWGEKYESIASMVYQKRLQVQVFDLGMLPHPKYTMLGASTDGVTSKLINLEIKCPPSRHITGIIPKHYWDQTQLQMEVLNLPLTHFLECKLQEFSDRAEFLEHFKTNNTNEYGGIIEIHDAMRAQQGLPSRVYRYSPINLTITELDAWETQQIASIIASPCAGSAGSSESLIYICTTYWRLVTFSCINIQRDFKWFQQQLPKIFQFWQEVEDGKAKGFDKLLSEINAPKTPVLAAEACLLGDSDDETLGETTVKKNSPKKPINRQILNKKKGRLTKESIIVIDL